ncbi:dTDP-4-amino-4,6-dideoxygalactose transaminase [Pseudomonas prosekii]|uniref:dTDP-4-amino-4,6-dideoxygalactose transaminase n=1 Tax=Pseudomonas prosekii TaxID=1148509 RepID=A0A3L8CD09_9PSED|nr:dTDP-4-amino-4,6-dideoxygalactose transaminase [Pseudomonas prosekii]RLU05621.1 dTDP-4-amino-4,6-dideoxygalactose transaminase [Pseudomonas prosekii]RLU13636.1 dTDP-4-amino-4,6-dideoxygalactose transaminase [Pseudomonas prosekii]
MTIPFNKPPYTGNEDQYVVAAMRSGKMSGDGEFTIRCQQWFEKELNCKKALLTPSCTQALEMAALLIDIQPGDEVIMPSYTFVSTANAFVLRGAKIVFVDIRKDTMNIDETLIEAAITERTKAIVPVHYAGIACEMDEIMAIAERHGLFVIEDAAQGMMSTYKGKALGTIGHMAAYSFHETKNYTSGGEGGLLLINDEQFIVRAEIIREKGTNRSLFFRGMIDKYTWVDVGSSYLPGELQAAYLYGQLEKAQEINQARRDIWDYYYSALQQLFKTGHIELPIVPADCVGNGHMFYIKVENIEVRSRVLSVLRDLSIGAVFHYIPLHSAPAGLRLGRFHGNDVHTTVESERLIRLPIWYGMSEGEMEQVINAVVGAVNASCQ